MKKQKKKNKIKVFTDLVKINNVPSVLSKIFFPYGPLAW